MIPVLIAVQMIVLHAIDGREIQINPSQVTSLRAAKENVGNQLLHEQVYCLINLTDGKFVSVSETCDVVKQLLESAE